MVKRKTKKGIALFLHYKRERKHLKKLHSKSPKNPRRHHDSKKPRTPPEILEIVFDHDIDIYDEEKKILTAKKCTKIRENKSPMIRLDFQMEKISTAGMLWLYAEIYQQKIQSGVEITCNYPPYKKAEKVLQHIGFFDLIGKEKRIAKEDIKEKDICSWHVKTGKDFDGEAVSKFINTITRLPPEKEKNIYILVLELIANTAGHAYSEDHQHKLWVMFSRIIDDNKLCIVVGDLGKTIPVTIKEYINTQSFIKTIPRNLQKDSELIKIATRSQESRKWKIYRGNGLRQIIDKIVSIDGQVVIYSRRGSVRYPQSRQARRKNQHLRYPVQGTITELIIPIQSDAMLE